jgi:hypothetical protein
MSAIRKIIVVSCIQEDKKIKPEQRVSVFESIRIVQTEESWVTSFPGSKVHSWKFSSDRDDPDWLVLAYGFVLGNIKGDETDIKNVIFSLVYDGIKEFNDRNQHHIAFDFMDPIFWGEKKQFYYRTPLTTPSPIF